MASIMFLDPVAGSTLMNIDTVTANSYGNIPVNYTLSTKNKWIFSNNPEHIDTTDYLGDYDLGNKCLNRVVVPAGTHQIFLSYHFDTNSSFQVGADVKYFGIQIYNPNASSITYQSLQSGYLVNGSSGYDYLSVIGQSVKNFFNSSAQSAQTILSGGSLWIEQPLNSTNSLISGSIKFTVTGQVTVLVYAYADRTKINGTATVIYKTDTGGTYSGVADGISYSANITLKASELLVATGSRKRLQLCKPGISGLHINNAAATSDLRPIKIATGADTTATITPTTHGQNLGNWGFIYQMNVTLLNDDASPRAFNGFTRCDSGTNAAWYNGTVKQDKKIDKISVK